MLYPLSGFLVSYFSMHSISFCSASSSVNPLYRNRCSNASHPNFFYFIPELLLFIIPMTVCPSAVNSGFFTHSDICFPVAHVFVHIHAICNQRYHFLSAKDLISAAKTAHTQPTANTTQHPVGIVRPFACASNSRNKIRNIISINLQTMAIYIPNRSCGRSNGI